MLFCGKGRKEGRKKKKRKREQKHGRRRCGRPRRGQLLGARAPARPASAKRRRRESALPAVSRAAPPRPSPEAAQAQRGRRRRRREPVPRPAPPRAPRPRSRCVHAPGRGRVRVALKERRQVSGGGRPFAEAPRAHLLGVRAPVRRGRGAGSHAGWGGQKAGLRGVPEEAESGRGRRPGLVSPRFPGAGSPRSLRGVMGSGRARKGLPTPPPWPLRATCGGARGSGPWGLPGRRRPRGGRAGQGGAGAGGRGLRPGGGSSGFSAARAGRGQVSQVHGERFLLCRPRPLLATPLLGVTFRKAGSVQRGETKHRASEGAPNAG